MLVFIIYSITGRLLLHSIWQCNGSWKLFFFSQVRLQSKSEGKYKSGKGQDQQGVRVQWQVRQGVINNKLLKWPKVL